MKIARISFLVFVAVAVTVTGLWPARQNIAQRFVIAELEACGLGPVRLMIGQLGFDHMTVSELSLLDGALTIGQASATYTPNGLMAGKITDINVNRLRTKGALTANGLTLPIIEALSAGADGTPPFEFPFETLTLTKAVLDISTPQGPVQAGASVQVANDGHTLTVNGSHTVNGDGLTGRGELHLKATAFDLSGLSGRISQSLKLNGFSLPGQTRTVDGHASIDLTLTGPEAVVTLTKPLWISQGKNKATLRVPEGLSLSLDEKYLTVKAPALDFQADAGARISFNGALIATLDRNGTAAHKVVLSGDRVRLDTGTNTVILKGLSATYKAKSNRAYVTVETLEAPGVLDTAPPVRLSLTVTPTDGKMAFSGTLTGKNNPIRMTIAGTHDTITGQGRAALDLAPLAFQPDGFQPADLMPRLIEFVQNAQGALSAAGTVAWTDKGLTPNINLLISDLSFSHGFLGIQRANGVIAIDSLTPLTTPKGQRLAIAAVNAGVPLTENVLTFHLAEGNVLVLESGVLRFAGGDIQIDAANIPLDGSPVSMGLDVNGVDLTQLTALTELKGLSASGTLSGRLPATLAAGDLNIKNAVLSADRPGILRYRPAKTLPTQVMGGTGNLAWQALDNFHYTSLELDLNGRTGGEMTLALHLAGSNPDVYGGYPMELNLSVQGRLAQALSQSMAGYQIPKRIEKKMRDFGKKKNR